MICRILILVFLGMILCSTAQSQTTPICDKCYAPLQPEHCSEHGLAPGSNRCENPIRPCYQQWVEGQDPTTYCPLPDEEKWGPSPWVGRVGEQFVGSLGQDCKDKRQRICIQKTKCKCDWIQHPENPNATLLVCVSSLEVTGTTTVEEWFVTGDTCVGTLPYGHFQSGN